MKNQFHHTIFACLSLFLISTSTIAQAQTFNCTDDVSGFTNAQLFDCLGITTLSVGDFKHKLLRDHLNSTSNTTQQIDNLFNAYQ